MNKFSFIDPATSERWDFEIKPGSVVIGLPGHKVTREVPVDFDPRTEFEGQVDAWVEWGATTLLEHGDVVFDEWLGLLTPSEQEEVEREARWEREHRRQESRSDIFI